VQTIDKLCKQGISSIFDGDLFQWSTAMPEFSIESNGRLEKTAIYYNGDQLDKVREVFVNMDEDGTFDAIIQYIGSNNELYTKNIFTDYFENVQTEQAGFSEEEAQSLQMVMISSDGDIENSFVVRNGQEQDGIVSLYIHIKAPTHTSGGLARFFGGQKNIPESPEFKAEITYREDDESTTMERIF
jgi:hypothetical protein